MIAVALAKPILLVEDNPVDVDLTLRAFRKRCLANPIVVCRDGEEALQQIERWDAGDPVPLVVLLDIRLPKVDGLEVLRQMKAHAKYRGIPVVMLTSSGEGRDVDAAYALGANSYIQKPVEFDRFMEVAAQVELYWCAINKPAL
jgi:CheY-like chemotaxis protein